MFIWVMFKMEYLKGATECRRPVCISRESGSTLLELITVMAILAIVLSFVGAAFMDWLPRYRLRRAAFDLFSNLQHARMLAIRKASEVVVVFDSGLDAYRLVCGGLDGRFNDGTGASDDVVDRSVRLADYGSGVTYGHGNATEPAARGNLDEFPYDGISYMRNIARFNSEGMTYQKGYVYLTNRNHRTIYAIGTPTNAGVIRLLQWTGNEWQ